MSNECSLPESGERADRFAEFRRMGRAVVGAILMFATGFGLLMLASDYHSIRDRLAELRGFRAGIPATMLPVERRYRESEIVYKGERMTLRRYPSSGSGTAASSDYAVIVNREGIVEAAFSADLEAGRDWLREHTE